MSKPLVPADASATARTSASSPPAAARAAQSPPAAAHTGQSPPAAARPGQSPSAAARAAQSPPAASAADAISTHDVLRLMPSPEAGEVALSLEAVGVMLDPDAPAGKTAALIFAPGEAAGRIEAVGEGVLGLSPGQRVAIRAAMPCGACPPCVSGDPGFCAAPVMAPARSVAPGAPPPRGMTIAAARCIALPGAAPAAAALLGPFAAAIHAVSRSGPVLGRRALVCGATLHGALAVAALRLAGAAHVTALGVGAGALDRMLAAGADAVIDASAEDAAAETLRGGVRFDICIDATGASAALAIAAEALRPGGVLTLLRGGDAAAPLARLAAKEIDLRGAARAFPDQGPAAALLRSGRAAGIGAVPDVFAADRIEDAVNALRARAAIDAGARAEDVGASAFGGVRAMLVWPGAAR
jgi:L-idonate 5-dehydrogenase